jgi:hypothetical protein
MQSRIHTDDSVEMKYYDHPNGKLDYMAWTFTGDLGCEYGTGTTVASVSCFGGHGTIKETFMGAMAYNRWDFAKNHYGITVGGGFLNNPGRYLALLPPINGADAVTGSPYFTENPGDKYHGADGTITFDWMPDQFITFRLEEGFRHSDVPYWTGKGGITPPGFGVGGTNGVPGQYVCSNGAASGVVSSGSGPVNLANDMVTVEANCAGFEGIANPHNTSDVWFPDLVRDQFATTFAVMVKF